MEYNQKSAEEQVKDREQLELYRRIDRETYFEELQLTNKLRGISTYEDVNSADRFLSSKRYAELRANPVEGRFDLQHLCSIHRYLFQDIYYFAGTLRDIDMQIDSITKFTAAKRLMPESERIFGRLKSNNFLKNLTKDEFVPQLAEFMTELNKLHPFREGNGRSKRAFVSQLCENAGYELNWSAVNYDEWKMADECAFDSKRDYGTADTTYLEHNLNKAISPVLENKKPIRTLSLEEFMALPNPAQNSSDNVME